MHYYRGISWLGFKRLNAYESSTALINGQKEGGILLRLGGLNGSDSHTKLDIMALTLNFTPSFNLLRSDLHWSVDLRDCKERQLNSAR